MLPGSVAYISTDGGIQTTATATTGFSMSDVVILVDNNFVTNAGYKRLTSANTAGLLGPFAYWGMSVPFTTPGVHTITVAAGGNNSGAGSPATVGGDTNNVMQGQLTVLIVNGTAQ